MVPVAEVTSERRPNGEVVPIPSAPVVVKVLVPVAPKAAVEPVCESAKIVVEVAFWVVRLPVLLIVVDAVPPNDTELAERTLEKNVDDVPFVIVSPPLKFKSVVVAFDGKRYAKVVALVR